MRITKLTLTGFRNFESYTLTPESGFNFIIGDNGAGKTSILEAIHFLSSARSHRTSQLNRIIHQSENQFTLFAQMQDQDSAHQIGLMRSKTADAQVKLDGETQSSHVGIAHLLPVLMFNPECFALLTDGSKGRRQMLDWGVFHFDAGFYRQWQIAKKALAQRNAALKSNLSDSVIKQFDLQLIQAANALDGFRQQYVDALKPILEGLIGDFLARHDVVLQYYRGWSGGEDLASLLASNRLNDRQKGFTHHGPHRADLRLRVGRVPAQDILSRGQQKLLICALKIAQGILFTQTTGKHPIYLLDDIASELDKIHQGVLIAHLQALDSQVFITAISDQVVADLTGKRFCLERDSIVASD